jgi:uncharacterized protein
VSLDPVPVPAPAPASVSTARRPGPFSSGFVRLLTALVIGGAALGSTVVLSKSAVTAFRIKHNDQRISVKGSAQRRIVSDVIVWRAEIIAQAPDMATAYRKLAKDQPEVIAFIKSHGVDEKVIKTSAVSIQEIHGRTKEGVEMPETITAYRVSQDVEVSSGEIEKVEKLSRSATELIDKEIYIQSSPPLYIYTKLAELKVQMLADASKDARARAEVMAQHTKSRITRLHTAHMGVMQINPAFSTDVSGEGNNDKTSLEKDVLAVVSATFGVE